MPGQRKSQKRCRLVPPDDDESPKDAGNGRTITLMLNNCSEEFGALATPFEGDSPLPDEETAGLSDPEHGDELVETRLTRSNTSTRSVASDYSMASVTESPNWNESDEARSSMVSLLSALYALVLVILSLAFEVSAAVVGPANTTSHDIFFCYLYTTALLFFLYCEVFLLRSIGAMKPVGMMSALHRMCAFRRKNSRISAPQERTEKDRRHDAFLRKRKQSMSLKRKASHSASSAGSLYLRMGCVVFGVVGLIMKGLHLFAAFDSPHFAACIHGAWIAETVLSAIFIFVQMFFIFQNTKLIIHRFKTVGRLGTMHLVATNLSLWIRSILKEQMTILQEINHGDHSSSDGHTELEAGRNTTNISVCLTPESRLGFNTLIADVEPFTTTCIVEYSLICAAVMYILWRNIGHSPRQRVRHRKQRFHVDCTSSTQGMFLGLFFMVYTIVSMVIFFTKVRSDDTVDALCVFYTTYLVLFGGSLLALGAGMYRMRRLYYLRTRRKNILLDDILLIVGLIGQLMFSIFSAVPLHFGEGGLITALIAVSCFLRTVQVLWQTLFIFFAQRLATLTPEMQEKNRGREMVTFLLMVNLSLFLINIFEIHKAAAIPQLFQFYGEGVWMIIAHSTVPLCIFYRFHSTVCLAEIWKLVYRVKESVA